MLAYRVFPHLRGARPGSPGHPAYLHPQQGSGRWDNPDRYRLVYLAASPTGAIGETFAHLSRWGPGMLTVPVIPGAVRSLATVAVDEEIHPVCDLDDPRALLERTLRPTDVVIRNRPRTQAIAAALHDEGRWAGLSWWSMHRPQWKLYALWRPEAWSVQRVEPLPGHPGLLDAARVLAKDLDRHLAAVPV